MKNYDGRPLQWLEEECRALLIVRGELFAKRREAEEELGPDDPLTRAYRIAQRSATFAYTRAESAMWAAAEREGVDLARRPADAMNAIFGDRRTQ